MPTAAAASVAATAKPNLTYLKDYTKPSYYVDHVYLDFHLDDAGLDTLVKSKLTIRPDCADGTPLVLDAECVQLVSGSLTINGVQVSDDKYEMNADARTLTLKSVPNQPFELQSSVRIKPVENTELSGLYMSDNCYTTQCEAQGFRRITPFPDRPDVMCTYTVRITANKVKFPVLLSNGNLKDFGNLPEDSTKHWALYEDPWKKPSYLFALVAGNLFNLSDTFTTKSGRNVDLNIYVAAEHELQKCEHAMNALKIAMKWEEDTYGLEYDLDIFNIVAVSSFNMGAMENKSLNIFNSRCVFASKDTATDADFLNVSRVIAHEYFHNWSGNRVTVSSWFQLSLKEGLTVFRDQCFSSDVYSAAVRRVRDVAYLRLNQFPEDSGPMAHPIQPKAFQTINNFYTGTVYKKGSEVIRMLHTLCGQQRYRKGTDIFFKRHDGQAITTDEWTQAIHDANPDVFDLKLFRRWYDQAGTPSVTVTSEYDENAKTLTLNMKQVVPPTHDQVEKLPHLIPIKTGIIGPDGQPVLVDDGKNEPAMEKVLVLQKSEQSFVLNNVPQGSLPSMLRNFSAPVRFTYQQGETIDRLAFQMSNDTDEFNRWEAGQKIFLKLIRECMAADTEFPPVPEQVIEAFRNTWTNNDIDKCLRAEAFKTPQESYILEEIGISDPVKIRNARSHVTKALAVALQSEFQHILDTTTQGTTYELDNESQGKRAMKNVALAYLSTLGKDDVLDTALDIVRAARNMTEVQTALIVLAKSTTKQSQNAFKEFAEKWKSDQLMMNKWLAIQAGAPRDDALEIAKNLMLHQAFKITVPNCCYALFMGYDDNMHIPNDGSGYEFIADQVIKLDKINAQVAARVARVFTKIKKYDQERQAQMRSQLERIKNTEGLSTDVAEIVGNCLDAK